MAYKRRRLPILRDFPISREILAGTRTSNTQFFNKLRLERRLPLLSTTENSEGLRSQVRFTKFVAGLSRTEKNPNAQYHPPPSPNPHRPSRRRRLVREPHPPG